MTARNPAELAAGAVVLVVALGFLAYAVAHTGRGGMAGELLHARFERIDGLSPGAEVRIGGVKVGSVIASRLDPQTFQAMVDFTVASDVHLPSDSSAAISSDGLLGGKYVAIVPGGETATIPAGGSLSVTQSAVNIEDLLGKFIFSAANLADDARKNNATRSKPNATSGDLPPLGAGK